MSLQKLIANYAAFNLWANTQFVNWLSQQEKDILDRYTPSSFTSLNYTLQHMLRTEKFWHKFIMQQDVSGFNWSVREVDAQVIMDELQEMSEVLHRDFSLFTEQDLLTLLSLNMPWAKNQLSRYEYIMHVFNHATFHRGQIVTMARSLGIEKGIPASDYNIFNTKN